MRLYKLDVNQFLKSKLVFIMRSLEKGTFGFTNELEKYTVSLLHLLQQSYKYITPYELYVQFWKPHLKQVVYKWNLRSGFNNELVITDIKLKVVTILSLP